MSKMDTIQSPYLGNLHNLTHTFCKCGFINHNRDHSDIYHMYFHHSNNLNIQSLCTYCIFHLLDGCLIILINKDIKIIYACCKKTMIVPSSHESHINILSLSFKQYSLHALQYLKPFFSQLGQESQLVHPSEQSEH